MAQSSKTRKSVKLTAARRNQIVNAITQAEAHYAPLAGAWPEMTQEHREAVLNACPVLSRVLRFADLFAGRW